MTLRTVVGRLPMNNPVTVASGTFGFGEEYGGAFDLAGLGAIVTKSITLHPRPGNPPPRILETPSGLINSVGLENPGVEVFVDRYLPVLAAYDTRIVVSIAGDRPEDYGELARRLGRLPGVDALELNVSCPNVSRGGLTIGCDCDATACAVRLARQAAELPLWVKLTPNVTDIVSLAAAALNAGANALALVNTLRGIAIDTATLRPIISGGLSGPAIRPVALRAVYDVYRALRCDIVGMGGITSVDDVIGFLAAGARAVAIGTGMFAEPRLPWTVISQLPERLRKLEVTTLAGLTGAAHREE